MIAWAKREEWRGTLAEFLDRHGAQACAAAGIEVREIADILGDDAATVVWGAAFEDLVATDLPGGRNLADDYLRRRGWKEGASAREYIAELRRSTISLYEVSGLVPGESMQLRDLVRGGDPVRVSEKLGSQGLRQWDRVATRVMPSWRRPRAAGSTSIEKSGVCVVPHTRRKAAVAIKGSCRNRGGYTSGRAFARRVKAGEDPRN